ncbi:MAG: YbaK/EbsC family protein [Pseudomonadota bacterium]
MSKSLARVKGTAEALGLPITVKETGRSTRTAAEAAAVMGCVVDQIGKSILIAGSLTGSLHLFLTPGGRQVDLARAADIMGEETAKADAAKVRSVTGFAIGGVSPLGHLSPIPIWIAPELLGFSTIWVAAGTPHHLFEIAPDLLAQAVNARSRAFLTEI